MNELEQLDSFLASGGASDQPDEMSELDNFLSSEVVASSSERKFPRSPDQIEKLRKTDPNAADVAEADRRAYQADRVRKQKEGFAYGLADPAYSLARPLTSVYDAATGDTSRNMLEGMIAARNSQAEKAGADEFSRVGGQIVSTTPAMAGVGRAASFGMKALRVAYPSLAPYLDFVSGSLAPQSEKGASLLAKAGNKALEYGSKFTSGAGVGAGVTALTSAGSSDPESDQYARNMLFGGAVNTAVPATFDAVRAGTGKLKDGWNFVRGQRAPEKARRVVEDWADDVIKPVDATQYVPGSQPTLAEVSQNPNLAVLQRTLQKDNPAAFDRVEAANNAARATHLEKVIGTADDIALARAEREAQRELDVSSLWKPGAKANPRPVVAKIEEILNAPGGRRPATKEVLQEVKDLIITENEKGARGLVTDPEDLYKSVRKHISDMLDKRNLSKSAGKLAASELKEVQAVLDDVIDEAAPGYKAYMENFSTASKQIDAMEHLQGLKLTDKNGNFTLDRVKKAVENIEKAKKSPGIHAAKHVSKEQLQALKDIQKDLARREKVASASMPRGSPTTQNAVAEGRKAGDTLPLSSGKLDPELIGTIFGNIAGTATGNPFVGTAVGNMAGRAGKGLEARHSARVTRALEDLILNPVNYRPSAADIAKPMIGKRLGEVPMELIPSAVMLRSGFQ